MYLAFFNYKKKKKHKPICLQALQNMFKEFCMLFINSKHERNNIFVSNFFYVGVFYVKILSVVGMKNSYVTKR